MPTDLERVAFLEAETANIKEDVVRQRGHISDLLTFKNQLEGAMGTVKWLTAAGLLSNLVVILKMFFGHG